MQWTGAAPPPTAAALADVGVGQARPGRRLNYNLNPKMCGIVFLFTSEHSEGKRGTARKDGKKSPNYGYHRSFGRPSWCANSYVFLAPSVLKIPFAYLISANDSVSWVIKLRAPPPGRVFGYAASTAVAPSKTCGGQAVRRDVAINCASKSDSYPVQEESFKRRGHRDHPFSRFQALVVRKTKSYPSK